MCADIATEREHRSQIHLEHRLPVIVWELVGRVPLLNTAAVEEDVNSVPIFEDLRGQLGYGFVGGEVAGIDLRFSAQLFNGFFGLLV